MSYLSNLLRYSGIDFQAEVSPRQAFRPHSEVSSVGEPARSLEFEVEEIREEPQPPSSVAPVGEASAPTFPPESVRQKVQEPAPSQEARQLAPEQSKPKASPPSSLTSVPEPALQTQNVLGPKTSPAEAASRSEMRGETPSIEIEDFREEPPAQRAVSSQAQPAPGSVVVQSKGQQSGDLSPPAALGLPKGRVGEVHSQTPSPATSRERTVWERIAEAREWVSAAPTPEPGPESIPRATVILPEQTSLVPVSLPAANAEPEVQNFTLSIGTIQLTVEEPAPASAAVPSPSPAAAPKERRSSSSDMASRLRRHYLRF